MSDQSQGEGWWIASDGKWYPPESAPGYQAPTAPPAAAPAGDAVPRTPAPGAPAQAPITAGAPADSGGSGKKMGMIIGGALLGLLAIGGIAAVALGGGDDDPVTEAVSDSTTTAPASDEADPATTTTTTAADEGESDTTAAAPATGGETIDDPLPLAGTAFTYEDFSGTMWSGTFFGVAPVDVDDDEAGACYLVLGTMTADAIDEGNVTSGFDTPDIAAVANGTVIDGSFSDCDSDGAEAAGYGRIIDAEITQGSSYAFHSEIYVEGTVPAELTAIVLGNATSDDARYYSVDILDSIPPAPENVGNAGQGETSPLAGATFTYTTRSDTTWQGEMQGLLPVDKGRFNDDDGSCFLVVGAMAPTELGEGFAANGFDTPDIGAIAGGEFVDGGFADCDETLAIEQGYRSILEGSVTTGTTFAFYAEIFVPADAADDITAIVLGSATSDDAQYYSPDLITAVTPPTLVVGERVPAVVSPLAGTTFTYSSFSDTEWEGTITGLALIETQSFNDTPGQCFAILGQITPTAIDEGTATSGFDTPDFSLLTQGFNYGSSFGGCDRSTAESAGYGWILDAEVTLGTSYPFIADFFIPGDASLIEIDAIVLGQASNDEAIFFEPLILDGIPAP